MANDTSIKLLYRVLGLAVQGLGIFVYRPEPYKGYFFGPDRQCAATLVPVRPCIQIPQILQTLNPEPLTLKTLLKPKTSPKAFYLPNTKSHDP